ncbi:MAG: serine/threonine protein kinase bacterial [Elusimicrobia bacterium]|nr:MAG: serine/threonine protein kinase bacterial [Elusimicrobiota bacterium]KAF0154120.1 MAG: serine/threonine protein kinase bacterial [Elusimicrobiota bacterium]
MSDTKLTQLSKEAKARAIVEEFRCKNNTTLLNLLFTDIVGSTKLKQELGDHKAVAMIQAHNKIVRDCLSGFAGAQEIETAGDSFFCTFLRPSEALLFALKLQSAMRRTFPARELELRVGVHLGEVVMDADSQGMDIYGLQIDTAARVQSLAEGGQILCTHAVFDNARQALKGRELKDLALLVWLNHGPYKMKGVEDPIDVYEVGEEGLGVLKPPKASEKARPYNDSEDELGWRPGLGVKIPGTEWTLEESLGRGGFGEVWLASHAHVLEKRVFKFCFNKGRVRALRRELNILQLIREKTGDYPGIVRLHEVYLESPPYYLGMEYVPGENLRTWLNTAAGPRDDGPRGKFFGRLDSLKQKMAVVLNAPLGALLRSWLLRNGKAVTPSTSLAAFPLRIKVEIAAQVAEALEVAHKAGVVHQDIKPDNILVCRSPGRQAIPKIKVSDFGVGRIVNEEALKNVQLTKNPGGPASDIFTSDGGTSLYLSPERLEGKKASPQSDIYSLGVILFQMASGDLNRAFTFDRLEEVGDPILRKYMQRMLSGNHSRRCRTAGEAAHMLRRWHYWRRWRDIWTLKIFKSSVAALGFVMVLLAPVAYYLVSSYEAELNASLEQHRPDVKHYNQNSANLLAKLSESLGEIALRQKDYEKAIEFFTEVIQHAPDNSDAYFKRGRAYAGKREYEKAVADYSHSIDLSPDSAGHYFNRGVCYFNLGNYDKAIFDFTKEINLGTNKAASHYALARIFLNKGMPEERRRHLAEACSLGITEACSQESH